MAHTVTWGAAFDATPAGSDDIKDGDDRIRELKTAVSERLALEHYFTKAGTNNWHGVHTPPFAIEAGATRTLAITDEIVCCSATCTVTVPAYTNFPRGKRFVIKNTGTGVITIARSGSDTFDGATSLSIATQYNWFEIICTGTATWYIVSKGYGANAIAVEGRTLVTGLAAGWTGSIYCLKDPMGFVHLEGYLEVFPAGTNPLILLPVGYRPARAQYFLNSVSQTHTIGAVGITVAGDISALFTTSGSAAAFDGITFQAS